MSLPTDDTQQVRDRYAALASAILAAFPDRLKQLDCGPGLGVRPFWISQPTAEEQTAFDALVSGWDWTLRTPTQKRAEDAKAAIAITDTPDRVLLLAVLKVIYASIAEVRAKVGLPSRTWDQLLAAVRQQIDAG